jgi:hypothetical protein
MKSRCAGKVDAAHFGEGVENPRFQLPALVGGDGVRASVTRYLSRQHGSGYRHRRNVQEGNGFWLAGEAIYCRQRVTEAL